MEVCNDWSTGCLRLRFVSKDSPNDLFWTPHWLVSPFWVVFSHFWLRWVLFGHYQHTAKQHIFMNYQKFTFLELSNSIIILPLKGRTAFHVKNSHFLEIISIPTRQYPSNGVKETHTRWQLLRGAFIEMLHIKLIFPIKESAFSFHQQFAHEVVRGNC